MAPGWSATRKLAVPHHRKCAPLSVNIGGQFSLRPGRLCLALLRIFWPRRRVGLGLRARIAYIGDRKPFKPMSQRCRTERATQRPAMPIPTIIIGIAQYFAFVPGEPFTPAGKVGCRPRIFRSTAGLHRKTRSRGTCAGPHSRGHIQGGGRGKTSVRGRWPQVGE
jgi:hypothetical protein